MGNIRITQIDGKLPNLALMAISAHHRRRGDTIHFTRDVERGLFEPEYAAVYGSCIFKFARFRADRLLAAFPDAIVGGTGMVDDSDPSFVTIRKNREIAPNQVTVESIIGNYGEIDYSIYPDFTASIGFTQRGCRMKCGFCVVPWKEGANVAVGTITQIWRGEGFPKNIHLLDNDFFGQPEWQERVKEARDGKFRICLNQGINVRLINDEAADALATLDYRDDQFKVKRLYTAWDNLSDEGIFFKGIDRLERAGVKPKNVMAYMLIGYDPTETWERIWYRFNLMVERGIMPYPMVFDQKRRDLMMFQRWVITGVYRMPEGSYDSFVASRGAKAVKECAESVEAYHLTKGMPSVIANAVHLHDDLYAVAP